MLKAYASYYDEFRTHPSLEKDAPDFRRAQAVLQSKPWCPES